MCCQVTVLISLLTWCNEWRHLCHGKIYEQRRWVGSNSWFILARSHTACIPHLILHKYPLNRIKPLKGVKITWKLIKRPSTVNNYFKLPSFYKIRQICAWNPFTSLSRQIRTHTDSLILNFLLKNGPWGQLIERNLVSIMFDWSILW